MLILMNSVVPSLEHSQSTIMNRARIVVPPLRAALRGLLKAVPQTSARRRGVPGVHATLGSRLRRGTETESIPASLFHLPGPDGLRRAVEALKRFNPDPALVADCERCIAHYEEFLRAENLTLDALQALLSQYLPEARDEVIARNAQVVFAGMRNLSGCSADAQIVTFVVFPGKTPEDHDEVVIQGFVGWERLREDAWPHTLGSRIYNMSEGDQRAPLTIDGLRVSGRSDALLSEFCVGQPPTFQRFGADRADVLYVTGAEVGAHSSCTFFVAEHLPDALSVRLDATSHLRAFNVAPRIPLRRLMVDVFLHDDVWPGIIPNVATFRIVPDGRVHEHDEATRSFDRLELGTSLMPLTRGLNAIDTSAHGAYSQLIHSSLKRMGKSPTNFRGWRLDVDYPVYGVQYSTRIDLSRM